MNAALRFYRLLQSYEELTRLEAFALKEDNLPYLNRLQARKRPLADKRAPTPTAAAAATPSRA